MYAYLLAMKPLPTKMLTAGIMFFISDYIAQFSENITVLKDSDTRCTLGACKPQKQADWRRLAHFFVIGTGHGCMAHSYYNWADQIFIPKYMPSGNVRQVFVMSAFDQLVWTPFWYNAFFFPMRGILNGTIFKGLEKYFQSIKDSVACNMVPMWFKNIAVWGPANVLIFSCIPTSYKPLFSTTTIMLWKIILSTTVTMQQERALTDSLAVNQKPKFGILENYSVIATVVFSIVFEATRAQHARKLVRVQLQQFMRSH
jgi:hypothetical protein